MARMGFDSMDAVAMAAAVRDGRCSAATLLAEARRRADAAAALNAVVQRFDPPRRPGTGRSRACRSC